MVIKNNSILKKESKITEVGELETKEQLNDYLDLSVGYIGFRDLSNFVINKNNCCFCGTCDSLCSRITVKENIPVVQEYDPECPMCLKYCAKTYFPRELFEKEFLNNNARKNTLLGCYKNIIAAKSNDMAALKVAQNGGVVTTLLIYALNTGLIDGVLLTDKEDNWRPKPIVAKTPEEILAAAGSKYIIAPSLLAYKDAVYKDKLEKLAFVGMPCQIQAARKLQLWPPLSDKFGQIKLIIGLYCSSNFSYDLIRNMVQEKFKISMNQIKKFDIWRGKFKIYTKDGAINEIPVNDLKKCTWSSCQYCKDYSAEFADISVGTVGAPLPDWNCVITRSQVGEILLDKAVSNGKISVVPTIDLTKLENEAQRKKLNVAKIDKKVLHAMRLLKVSDIEIKTYTTLVSLGPSDLSILNGVMKEDEKLIRKVLSALQQREWIIYRNGVYRSVNPTQILNSEIYKIKKNLEKMIVKVKTDALIDLEALFLQNNLTQLSCKEFIDLL